MSSHFSESPQDRPEEGYTGKLPSLGRAAEPAEDSPDVPRLGSLAQKARGKQLNQARWILIVIGILTILGNFADLAAARSTIHNSIEQAIAKAGGRGRVAIDQARIQQIEEQALQVAYLIDGAFVAMGILFVILGALIRRFPVPATVIALVLYILATVANFGILFYYQGEGAAPAMGTAVIIRIVIIAALVKGVQAALAYERERSAVADLESM